MTRLRTTLITLGAGTALVATGAVVASSALAAPAPVAAVAQFGADAGSVAVDDDATESGSPRAAARGWWRTLTDEQRSCLQGERITRPVGRLDDAERAALHEKVAAAAGKCGVTLPFPRVRAFWDGLTEEQQTCIKDAGVNRPWGPLTREQRQQVRADLRAAAERCGVAVPTRTPATS